MDRSRSNSTGATLQRPRFLGLRTLNWVLLIVGIVAVLFGYLLLNRGSVTAAPLMLVFGYLVLIPAGLMVGLRRSWRDEPDGPGGE
ncbi:MAG: hypothetical protein M8835_09590 [marine benthic group bacterium]|jgi:uncharacterized membrane protein HdeD (DUF308 family)|nr:hypothetical protein [Gemmatimonadota bacterium]MCL7978969.1 hypothetical protein [Gemmatimonadota bacterium]